MRPARQICSFPNKMVSAKTLEALVWQPQVGYKQVLIFVRENWKRIRHGIDFEQSGKYVPAFYVITDKIKCTSRIQGRQFIVL